MANVTERFSEKEVRYKHCKMFLTRKGMTQREVATALGVTEFFISRSVNESDWSQRVADFFGYKRELN